MVLARCSCAKLPKDSRLSLVLSSLGVDALDGLGSLGQRGRDEIADEAVVRIPRPKPRFPQVFGDAPTPGETPPPAGAPYYCLPVADVRVTSRSDRIKTIPCLVSFRVLLEQRANAIHTVDWRVEACLTGCGTAWNGKPTRFTKPAICGGEL